MNRPHFVVDALNVIGSRPTGWWRDRDGAILRFARDLRALAEADSRSVTLIIDGRPLAELPEGQHGGLDVLYASRSGQNAADDRIVEFRRWRSRAGQVRSCHGRQGPDRPGQAAWRTGQRTRQTARAFGRA